MRSLYIHLPFCIKKCNYCDFASYAGCYDAAERYVDAVIAEMKEYPPQPIQTVYLGGGTPSSLEKEQIVRLMNEVRVHFCLSEDAEITIEANPATLTREKLLAYRNAGINRISVGVQSFDDKELSFLGRLHSAAQAEQTLSLVRESGFDNASLDLMFGLPNQEVKTLKKSLERAIALCPEHISCYALKIEEGTPLYAAWLAQDFLPMEDDAVADLYTLVRETLTGAGYTQYELSNFCLTGRQSRHNSVYWQCGEYIGLGAGAASYYNSKRYCNTPDLQEYLSGKRAVEEEEISIEEQMSEFVILGLRMVRDGISEQEFKKRFGVDMDAVFGKQLQKHQKFIKREGGVLTLTPEAYFVSNAIFADFI
ncbi:MAG: radical SAM family heme chaperone HemW [Ruminococcaceae bacterium]|nr:radical SAM family heme chaperone HemW [Oscillospiraceae bacterium]